MHTGAEPEYHPSGEGVIRKCLHAYDLPMADGVSDSTALDLAALDARRDAIKSEHMRDAPTPSTARGVHHVALLCSDVEQTVHFYQDLLEFPLTDMFENRDYQGSTHFFFDLGNGNALAFFDFPGLDLGPYAEVLGGLQHLAISVPPDNWERLKDKLDDAGIPYDHVSGSSLYFRDPDGVRLELISDPLGTMYGTQFM